MTDAQDRKKYPTFAEVKRAALQAIDRVLAHWLPGGKRVDGGKEYTAPNPTRADKRAGSLKVSLAKGTWSDFATGDKGGDLIDLVHYLDGGSEVDACNKLADFLGVTPGAATTSAPTSSKASTPEWVPVLPIPDEAMRKLPTQHGKNGIPSKVWIYRAADGQPLMVLYRFDLGPDDSGTPRKVFAPLTWCKHSGNGSLAWRWLNLPEPRPLLRLDELATRATDPVVLCEGEKSADAAAELLPGYVATCWPNGTNSWQKADFAPLAGRHVLLWPDNDAPGLKCMDALAEHLRQLGAASVRSVALTVFGQHPGLDDDRPTFAPGGEWAEGDDAADAVAKGWTTAHLAELERTGELFALATAAVPASKGKGAKPGPKASASSKPAPTEKPAPMPAGFRVTADGVFYAGDDGEARPVCSRLEILARTRDEKGQSWGLLVEFDDPDGDKKRLNIPARSMAGDFGKEVVGPLVDMGLRLAPVRTARNSRNDLQSYLQGYDSAERARLVTRLGWHGDAYLLPDRQIGQSIEHLHFYEAGAQLPPISQVGTLEQWQQQVGALCVGNSRLVLAVSVGFAGALLYPLGVESGGFHFYGDSSMGKSTMGRVACSVYGPPEFECSWRSTDNALESIAAARSDGLLVLDEISQADGRIVGDAVYMLGNGVGKARANDRGQAGKPVQAWRLLFVSCGEYTLAQTMAEAGRSLKAGMDVRMLPIPADAGKGFGVYDTLHGFDGGAELTAALKARAGRFYGTPALAFLSALCEPGKLRGYAAVVRSTVECFTVEALPADASGQAQRAAARFGLVAAAGELATALGVTGWPDGTATHSAKVCLGAWLAERGGAGNLEGDAIVQRLRLTIERYGEGRFTRWDKIEAKIDENSPRTIDRLGFRRTIDHGYGDVLYTTTTYYLLPTAWRDEVFKGMNTRNVNRELVARGILLPGNDGRASQSITLPGMPKGRAYVVDGAKLFADEDEVLAAAA